MKWVTWEQVGVDRMACAWLIMKYIDPQAEFLFVPAGHKPLPEGAEPFDIPGVRLSHHRGHCTFYKLYREIKMQGYTGQERQVHRFLLPLRKNVRIIQKAESGHIPLQDFSAQEAVWLFVCDPATLDDKEQTTLTAICQASETASTTYQLVQKFRHLLHHREGEKLDDWLSSVKASQIRELQSFVVGVERDKAAVIAGLTLPQNNGLVEGHVNKLKLIKRMGYGRAGFALLRQRVLHAL